jgi:F-type H+-transporting ATPase subunit a
MKGSDCVGESHYLFDINLFGHTYGFSLSIVIQWIIILTLAAVSFVLTRKLERIPGKRQSAVEMMVDSLGGFVKSTMGEQYEGFIPYVGALGAFLLLMNLTGLVGIDPPTMDYSVALGMALVTFLIIQVYAIKKLGVGHYFLGYTKPMFFLLPNLYRVQPFHALWISLGEHC